MSFSMIKTISISLFASAAIFCGSSAGAMQVMEFRAETLLLNSAQLKTSLNLNPNQQTLWQQTEAKLHGVIHQRDIRQGRLQSEFETVLSNSVVELRDLNSKIDQEEQITLRENKEIREICLTLYDALDDQQRSVLQAFLLEQLLARPDQKKDSAASNPSNNTRKSGSGHSRGGMGGSGGATQF